MTIQRNKDTKCIYGKLKDEYPNLLKYLVNKDDGDLTLGCRQQVLCICKKCGYIKEVAIYRLVSNGFNCPNCSSKISYPNRFLYKLLSQLNINFQTETRFEWASNKRYDFYIQNINCIIEAHDAQHYQDCSWSKVKDQQINDSFKEKIARENGINNYIQLDCRYSKFDYIKQSILNSQISNIFDLTNIDWNKIDNELKEV